MLTAKLAITWLLRLTAAFIMIQSLFFKFSGADESIYIFSKLGMEPWGRIGTGIVELVASILLLLPRTTWLGAGLGAGILTGAIFFHLTSLGIDVQNDGGQLFVYAVVAWTFCVILLLFDRQKLQIVIQSAFSR